ncbi:hypothetical protein G6F56_012367 [Rhizopus delemar]|nr:hypothetical protein G6F56_012367 [Rhizopus delemar]
MIGFKKDMISFGFDGPGAIVNVTMLSAMCLKMNNSHGVVVNMLRLKPVYKQQQSNVVWALENVSLANKVPENLTIEDVPVQRFLLIKWHQRSSIVEQRQPLIIYQKLGQRCANRFNRKMLYWRE